MTSGGAILDASGSILNPSLMLQQKIVYKKKKNTFRVKKLYLVGAKSVIGPAPKNVFYIRNVLCNLSIYTIYTSLQRVL